MYLVIFEDLSIKQVEKIDDDLKAGYEEGVLDIIAYEEDFKQWTPRGLLEIGKYHPEPLGRYS